MVTAINPYRRYENSTALAKEALETNRGIYELVLEKKPLSKEALDEILKPENMTGPRPGVVHAPEGMVGRDSDDFFAADGGSNRHIGANTIIGHE